MIRIITDSASDIDLCDAAALGVTVLPMQIQIGEKTYRDRYDISADDFYRMLIENDTLPKTSQINPFTFEEEYKKASADGDPVLVIVMSSELSGTYQSAVTAASEYENIYVVDSLNVTIGEQCLIRLALKYREQGMTAPEIAAALDRDKGRIAVIALLDTLEYLKKGGRISAASAFVGNLLTIKPVVGIRDGKVAVIGRARGSKNGNNMLMELIRDGGIDFELPLLLGYSGLDITMLEKYAEDSRAIYDGHISELEKIQIGSTIGTHAGPGAIAAAFFRP